MRPEYCARTQSSLNRLATNSVTLEKSSETCATSGLIQVLNCCSGSSCASWSAHACHRLSPAPMAALAARLLFCPSLILGSCLCGYCGSRKRRILDCPHVVHKDVFGLKRDCHV